MTSVNQLKKDIETVKRALCVDDDVRRKGEEIHDLLRRYNEAVEKATEGMTRQEKIEFEKSLAKQVAKDYAEGLIK